MSKFRDILQETHDTVSEIKKNSTNNRLEQVQFACQLWNLNQMIRFVDFIARMRNHTPNKQK